MIKGIPKIERSEVIKEIGKYIGNDKSLVDKVITFPTETIIILLGYYQQQKQNKYVQKPTLKTP